jgi:hypothetical protein
MQRDLTDIKELAVQIRRTSHPLQRSPALRRKDHPITATAVLFCASTGRNLQKRKQ